LSGCPKANSGGAGGAAEAEHDDHDHGEEGPPGGHIIELGAEDHHAELMHDDATHLVGIYILGGDAKTATPIATESVTINVTADGAPSQYVLPAKPQSGEAGGNSSYFELVSEPLCAVVCGESEAKNAKARLSLKVGDKPYSGMIETDHHDHDHDHE
jgi:hypothetical protein